VGLYKWYVLHNPEVNMFY